MIVLTGAYQGVYFYYGACPGMLQAGDGLSSVVALSNISGTIVETYSRACPSMFLAGDAFGNTTVCNVNGTPLSPNASLYDNPYMYTARRYDSETSLYYYRARIYSPTLGRFLQPDPIGYTAGMNMYAYCGNNPISWVDPWGLEAKGLPEREELIGAELFLKDIEFAVTKVGSGIGVILFGIEGGITWVVEKSLKPLGELGGMGDIYIGPTPYNPEILIPAEKIGQVADFIDYTAGDWLQRHTDESFDLMKYYGTEFRNVNYREAWRKKNGF